MFNIQLPETLNSSVKRKILSLSKFSSVIFKPAQQYCVIFCVHTLYRIGHSSRQKKTQNICSPLFQKTDSKPRFTTNSSCWSQKKQEISKNPSSFLPASDDLKISLTAIQKSTTVLSISYLCRVMPQTTDKSDHINQRKLNCPKEATVRLQGVFLICCFLILSLIKTSTQ